MIGKENYVQLSLLEPNVTETVEIAELYGPEPGGVFDFLDGDFQSSTVKTCWGDLIVMVNALTDYADILEGAVGAWCLEGYHAGRYQLHAARCRKIAAKYAAAIGYDRDKAIAKCRKAKKRTDDFGEDAMVLATFGTATKKEAKG